MKKIAIIYSGGNNYGGMYTFFRDIIKEIRREKKKNDIQIDIFSVTDLPPGNLFDNKFKKNIPKIIIKFINKFNYHLIFSSLLIPLFYYKKLKEYDKIIINQELAFPLSLLFKNTITIIHGTAIYPAKVWWKEKKFIYSIFYYILHINCYLTYKVSKKIYTVSEFTKNIVKKYNKNIIVNGWGCDISFWKYNSNVKKENFGFKKNDFLMIFVGRFDIGKGSNILVNIMKSFNNNKIKLICVSKKPKNYKSLEKNNIFFFENISEKKLRDLYSISNLFIFPSKYEGYGYVIAEALSVGLPIITTNVGLGEILKRKYENKYSGRIYILQPYDKENKYIDIIKNKYLEKALGKINYNIPEINIKDSVKRWAKTFSE